MKVLNVYRSAGTSLSVGWPRDDVDGVIHVFAQAAPGEPFQASNGNGNPHWPCAVCEAHGYTAEHFHAQVKDALARGPDRHV